MKRRQFVVAIVIGLVALCNQALAMGGYWKPVEGKAYTVTFTDEKSNVVVGEFKKRVQWQWEKDGKVTIEQWDDDATFVFKDEAGKEHKIDNGVIRGRILDLAPGMRGKLKGDIKDALK